MTESIINSPAETEAFAEELSKKLHGGEISRSGVNHRLGKIVQYAIKKGYLK